MKINIAILCESVRPSRGGCETYVADLSHWLVSDGHRVHIYCVESDSSALPAQVSVHSLPRPTGPRCWRPWAFARACQQAVRGQPHDVVIGLVKSLTQDVLMLQGGFHFASAAANVWKHPTWWLRAVAWLGQRCSLTYWSYRLLERRQLAAAPLVVVPSQWMASQAQSRSFIDTSTLRVVPNAIAPERLLATDRLRRRTTLREQLALAPCHVAGLFCGHNYRLKGLAPLLSAFAEVPNPDLHLLVCGDPRVRGWRRRAEKLGLQHRVHFLGFVPDIRDAYFAADFLVHPSFYDPCALVTLEALACGLPVLTTKTNGAHELLPPPLATLTVESGHDHAGLVRGLELLCDAGQRAELTRAARQAAAAWTMRDHFQALVTVLREAIDRKSAA